MRRRILLENQQLSWQKLQKTASPKKNVVFILTKFNGDEVIYDDFWDAVLDAEDGKFCGATNMISAYYETADEDGLNSYELVPDGKPYDGHWTEEEGVVTEPSQSYYEYVTETGLTEASLFPTSNSMNTNWVARIPVGNKSTSTSATSQAAASTSGQKAHGTPTKFPGQYQRTAMNRAESMALTQAADNDNQIKYALAMIKIYLVRLAPKFGIDISDPTTALFYDLFSLCANVDEEWPTIQEAKAEFQQTVGRPMSVMEEAFMHTVLKVLSGTVAPDAMCEVFQNASDFYDLRASKWLDSECGYDDYEYAFELGWAGNPEEDWTDMMGRYNHAGEYLEMAYSYGMDSHAWLKQVCGI